jgi:hypothetical protein
MGGEEKGIMEAWNDGIMAKKEREFKRQETAKT